MRGWRRRRMREAAGRGHRPNSLPARPAAGAPRPPPTAATLSGPPGRPAPRRAAGRSAGRTGLRAGRAAGRGTMGGHESPPGSGVLSHHRRSNGGSSSRAECSPASRPRYPAAAGAAGRAGGQLRRLTRHHAPPASPAVWEPARRVTGRGFPGLAPVCRHRPGRPRRHYGVVMTSARASRRLVAACELPTALGCMPEAV